MFSVETRALMTLGYGLNAINNGSILFPANLGADGLEYVLGLLTEITALDLELKANITDSMTAKLADIHLNYAQYVAQASARGSRLLETLATAIDVPVAYDRFKNGAKGSSSVMVRNYY